LQYMGVSLDEELNNKIHGDEAVISTPDSKVKVVVIPTDEEFMIASDTMQILAVK
ncbi:MAG: acetate kinase, partial [Bacteroidaceae bacterium]|nr:acetate kinase [Bacteroidaceae bacterium]